MDDKIGVKHAQIEGTVVDLLPLTVRNTAGTMQERVLAEEQGDSGVWPEAAAVHLGRAESGKGPSSIPLRRAEGSRLSITKS